MNGAMARSSRPRRVEPRSTPTSSVSLAGEGPWYLCLYSRAGDLVAIELDDHIRRGARSGRSSHPPRISRLPRPLSLCPGDRTFDDQHVVLVDEILLCPYRASRRHSKEPRAYNTGVFHRRLLHQWPRAVRLPEPGGGELRQSRAVTASSCQDVYGLAMTSPRDGSGSSFPADGECFVRLRLGQEQRLQLGQPLLLFAARSSAWEKSFDRSYNSQTSFSASQPFSCAAVLGVSQDRTAENQAPSRRGKRPGWRC